VKNILFFELSLSPPEQKSYCSVNQARDPGLLGGLRCGDWRQAQPSLYCEPKCPLEDGFSLTDLASHRIIQNGLVEDRSLISTQSNAALGFVAARVQRDFSLRIA